MVMDGNIMFYVNKSVIIEMLLIILLALAIGLTWNHRMLRDAWSGKPVAGEKVSSPPTQKAVPLPLGLMQVKDLYDRHEAIFVDARDRSAYHKNHIDGALSLPVGELDTRLAVISKTIAPSKTIVVYCNGFGCHDSNTVAERLMGFGYSDVFVYEGGFPEWLDAGYPTAGGDRAH